MSSAELQRFIVELEELVQRYKELGATLDYPNGLGSADFEAVIRFVDWKGKRQQQRN